MKKHMVSQAEYDELFEKFEDAVRHSAAHDRNAARLQKEVTYWHERAVLWRKLFSFVMDEQHKAMWGETKETLNQHFNTRNSGNV